MSKPSKKRILIVSHDKIGPNMAGPGIRYHHMAEVLTKKFDVTVGFFDPSYVPPRSFVKNYDAMHIDRDEYEDSFKEHDIIIALWLSDPMIQLCNKRGIFVVFDIYAPGPVENLILLLYGNDPIKSQTDYAYEQSISDYVRFFRNGDLFLFSNRRQLDYWIGYVFGSDIIRPSSYPKRPLFDRFIYAPMGIDAQTDLTPTKPVLRGKNGIKNDDKILLWTGGIWNWFDAQTLIKAMYKLSKERPDIKLVFLGTQHPNPDVPAMKEAADALSLAKEYGLYNRTVFIHEGWVPYDKRIPYLLEADAAVNTTKQSIESEFSHRTRVLDHILTELPTIATEGDYLSDEIIKNDLGITVPSADVDALVGAIKHILAPKNNQLARKQIAAAKDNLTWESTLAELLESLSKNPTKLQRVAITKTRQLPKGSLLYKAARKLLPSSVKNSIVRILRYGN